MSGRRLVRPTADTWPMAASLPDRTSLEFPGTPAALPYNSMRIDGAILASIGEIGTLEADSAFIAVLRREDSLHSLVKLSEMHQVRWRELWSQMTSAYSSENSRHLAAVALHAGFDDLVVT